LAKIMIVDDEETVRMFLKRVVEEMGHTAIEAENGVQGLDLLADNQIDLFFVDVYMPKMNGIGYLEKVKKMDPNAVIIMMTGHPSADTIVETIEDDGYTYISKPMKVEHVQDLITRGLAARAARIHGE